MAVKKGSVPRDVSVVIEITCDNCGGDIPLMFPENGNHQGRGMLTVDFNGGYGEFIDGHATADLCHDCAILLQKAFPALKKIMDNAEFAN